MTCPVPPERQARGSWHAEARRLRAEGWKLEPIAALFGVHHSRVWQVCHRDADQFRARHREYMREWQRRKSAESPA